MKRAALYARYSSDLQRDASIADQIDLCRRYAEQMGFDVVDVFEDRAISGSSTDRPGYQALLRNARAGAFDVIVVEALDRLTRRLADVAQVHDELQFLRVELFAVNAGQISLLQVGMLGTIGQVFLADLGAKTKRGQAGRIRDGAAAAGISYGYDTVPDATERGLRTINPAEAAVVTRIFEMFAGGVSPRQIAHRLNDDGVRGPGGRPWGDTTIRGQRDRGTGILNNELYIGRRIWNRCSYVKNPKTGRRVARLNPRDQWTISEVPDLRIVSDELWHRVKRRQERTTFQMARDDGGNALNRAHRRKFLLSGLLVCGCCGAGYTIVGKDRYGCAGRRSKGTCTNDRTISRQEIEGRILLALKERLLTPDLVHTFTQTYQEEVNRLAKEALGQRASLEGRLAACQRKIDSLIAAIEDGLYQPSMKTRLEDLEGEKAMLTREIAQADQEPRPISVHPNLGDVYRRKVEELERLLDGEQRDEAMEIIRAMIDEIVLSPRAQGAGLDAELRGDLARILALCVWGGVRFCTGALGAEP